MSDLITTFRAARRVGVPIVAVDTPDPEATCRALGLAACMAGNNGRAELLLEEQQPPVLQWDVLGGLKGRNATGIAAAAQVAGEHDPTKYNGVALCEKAVDLPPQSVLFMHLANRWIVDPVVVQGVWNLRDKFKANGRTLVLLSRGMTLPPELQEDVVSLDEPLPDAGQLAAIVARMHEAADLDSLCTPQIVERAVEALRGLSAFAAEQVTAMSLSRTGIKVDELWERKRKQIEQTPGLKVFREGDTFEQIGGCDVVKGFLARVMRGEAKPAAVVFVDEIEKMLGGAKGDMSGVTQDQLGILLSYMQDHGSAGMIFVGPPGAAKSAIAKAAGNEGGVPTIQLDLGAAKGSLVGQSEQQIRTALKVITAVSNGRSLWIATCNAIADLPPELRRRFTLGTFFFDLPTAEERELIWHIHIARYFPTRSLSEARRKSKGKPVETFALPADEGWTGAEIRNCCEIAWRLGCSLTEAAAFVVPVSRSAADQIQKLREQADGRFLSASVPGVYSRRVEQSGTRKLEVE